MKSSLLAGVALALTMAAPAAAIPADFKAKADALLEASPTGKFTVALPAEGPATVQLTGQSPIPVKAISTTEFKTAGADAGIALQAESGKVTRPVLHQGGRELPAKKD